MAGRAILHEGGAALRTCKVEQLRIVGDVLQRRGGELADHGSTLRLERVELRHDRLARPPIDHAAGERGDQRPGRVRHPIADRPDDGQIEQPEPPAWQRRVQFTDAVPDMAGGGRAGDCVDVPRRAGGRMVGHISPHEAACGRPHRTAAVATATARR